MSRSRPGRRPLPDIEFPGIRETTLDHGLTVLTVSDNKLPRVSLKLALPAGRTSNPAERGGVVELTAELLKEGAGSRSASELAAFMDRWALDYDSSVLMEQTILTVKALGVHLRRALEFLSDITLRPKLEEEELSRLKTRWRSELIAQRASAEFLASERLFADHFGVDHPYRRVGFTSGEMEGIDREAVGRCHGDLVRPAGAQLLAAGDIEHEEAVRAAAEFFADWPGGEAPRPDPRPPVQNRRRVTLVHRPHSTQARLVMGLAGLPRNDDDWLRLQLMNRVLGGGGSARLFLNLREDKGFTYGIYSFVRGFRNAGMLVVASDLNAESLARSIEEIFAEMQRLQDAAPAEDEVERARSEIVGSMLRRLETPGSVGSLELSRRHFGLAGDYYARMVARLQAVSGNGLRDMARRVLHPDRATIVAVGDRDTLLPQLESLGAVRVVDHNGVEQPTSGKDGSND